ncbi:MAG: CRTAC1 family protein [Myxococcota bacterium]|nr:CRTAC1 family protein [Myxococcota bacterium]
MRRSTLTLPLALSALACANEVPEEAVEQPVPLFTEAVLEPPFKHANAVWAGVALFDANGDDLLDMVFTNGTNHRDGLYINQGDGRFVDHAETAGFPAEPQHGGVVSGDIDNDGDEDLIMTIECSNGTLAPEGDGLADGGFHIFRNDGTGNFTLETTEPIIQATIETCPISVDLFDVDNDGDLDLLTANGLDLDQIFPWVFRKDVIEAADYVLFNNGDGIFTYASEIPSPIQQDPDSDKRVTHYTTFTSVMMDLRGEGEFMRVAGAGGTPVAVWSNHDGTMLFEPQLSEVGEGIWMGLTPGDFRGNGTLQLYGTNMGLSPLIAGYDNLLDYAQTLYGGDGAIEDLTTHIFHGLIEADDNGMLEVAEDWTVEAEHTLTGDVFDGFIDPDSLEPRYPEWIAPEGFERYGWGWGAVSLDYDADGWVDVAYNGNNCSAPMDIIWDEDHGAGPGALLRNTEGTGFSDVTWSAGVANIDRFGRYVDGRGIATGDLNGDGYADLVFANRTYNPSQSSPLDQEVGIPRVWLSTERENNYLRIKVDSQVGNRQGLGTQVWVEANGREVAHGLGLGGGTNSSSERALTIGIGDAEQVDLRVRYRSGTEIRLEAVEANQEIILVEE